MTPVREWNAGEWFVVLCIFVGCVAGLVRATYAVQDWWEARRRAVPPVPAPRASHLPRCSVVTCPHRPTHDVHGWALCDTHFYKRNAA